ncbi:MAG TPA: hypothetical protein VFQ61_13065 [Polyangiaceae bacterium]|nr:hypothetical protein [Polyangiaceae bacterium]
MSDAKVVEGLRPVANREQNKLRRGRSVLLGGAGVPRWNVHSTALVSLAELAGLSR